MTYKVTLWDKTIPNKITPDWWRNYLYDRTTENNVPLSWVQIDEDLIEYRAKYKSSETAIYLEFEDEKYFSMFLLRYAWS